MLTDPEMSDPIARAATALRAGDLGLALGHMEPLRLLIRETQTVREAWDRAGDPVRPIDTVNGASA